MAEPLEGEFRIDGIDDAIRFLKSLKEEVGDLGDEAKRSGAGWGSLSQQITAGVVSIRAAYDAISGLIDATKEAAEEWERQAGVINRFNGNIDEASRRVNGLISDFDLMVQQNKAAAAGLEITSEQFATLAVRASEWAAATGQDATEAFDKLMQSVATGEEGPLKELGVSLEGLTTVQQRQERALADLTEGYEDAESKADSLAGAMLALETSLDNAETEMIQAVEQSGLLEGTFEDLGTATERLLNKLDLLGGDNGTGLSALEQFSIIGAASIQALTEKVTGAINAFSALLEMQERLSERDLSGALDVYRGAREDILGLMGRGQSFGDRVSELAAEGMRSAEEAQAEQSAVTEVGGSGPRRRSASRDLGMGPGESISAYEFHLDLLAAQREIQAEIAENEQLKAEAAAEEIRRAKERNRLAQEELETNAALKAEEAERHEAQLKADAKREKALRGQQRMQRGAEEFAGLIQSTLELAAEGQDNLGKSFVTMIDEWLKQFAIQEAYKGAAAFAEGVGNAVMNTGHAAAKFAEAAQHFALAAVAGGASAAIPNQGGGGSAGAGAGAGGGPANAGRDSGGGGGPVTIIYNAPVAEANLGRQQRRHQAAAERRGL